MNPINPTKLQTLCENLKKAYTPRKGEILFFDLTSPEDPRILENESELSALVESLVATEKPYAIMNYTGPFPVLTIHGVTFIKQENMETGKTLDVVNDGMSTEDMLALRRELRQIRGLLPYSKAS